MKLAVDDEMTPRSKSKKESNTSSSYSRIYQQSLSYAAAPTVEPEVNVLPPTPPGVENTSKFSRMARGLAKEIDVEQERIWQHDERPPTFAQSTLKDKKKTDNNCVPLRSVVSELKDPVKVYAGGGVKSVSTRTPVKGKVYLPDMTGLTSVVASPAKFGSEYLGYETGEDMEIDGELFFAPVLRMDVMNHLFVIIL